MMNIKIYQVNRDRDYNKVQFMPMDILQEICGSADIDSSIYDQVFSGKVDCETLEDVFIMFNTSQPFGYNGCSLSVSDVVEVVLSIEESVFYYCDKIGFRHIDFDPDECEIDSKEVVRAQIGALLVEPHRTPEIIIIDPALDSLQDIVGGDIALCSPFNDDVAIICNEEGKVDGMPPNRAIYEGGECGFCYRNRKVSDIIHGTFLVVYTPGESEKLESMPLELVIKYAKRFLYPEAFLHIGNDVLVFPIKPVLAEKER